MATTYEGSKFEEKQTTETLHHDNPSKTLEKASFQNGPPREMPESFSMISGLGISFSGDV
ncbi:hypothetical protein M7I_4292 [Glarea lozoyensis 74030]|uniref:Uncharacterized protein n=1 Tax=Glarea lozoyensis (strain ATCC 74030 / MF5533) TaxID=1104152 RepID=H0ENS9_GLAL7|nr:hypothetical protein M7I_4292 [Glarea lozoyensis 74030]